MIVFPRLIVDCLRLEKVEAPTIRFLLTTTNNWLFIMFTNYQFVVSNVVTQLLHQFGYLFLLKMFSLWIRRWFIYAKRWGWISSLVHFTIIGMIFHCDWTITAWQGQDMAHWTPSKSHTYEGAGQFCGRLIFSFVLNSHLFLPFPYLGILRFCTLQNGPQILIRKLSFFAPSLECEPCQCEQKS